MHDSFLADANTKLNEYLLKTEELFVNKKNEWFNSFANYLSEICKKISALQKETGFPAISYLEYTMLYTNFINRHYVADIMAYGQGSYKDKMQKLVGSYDVSFVFVYYDELWNSLEKMKKRYIGRASAQDVVAFMLRALPSFYSYLTNIARFAIAESTEKKIFANIEKNEDFNVNVGDYMARTQTVYAEKKNKDASELAVWFSERLPKEYTFGDYSELDFTWKFLTHSDFRYARFQNSTLKQTYFFRSTLIGANYRNANMEGAVLDYCFINEADFSGAVLKNASFKNVRGKAGLTDKAEWKFAGFLPVSFRWADLACADFRWSNLAGADFRGANLTNADFRATSLVGADFRQADLTGVDFWGANLTGVDFRDANLTGANLTGSILTGSILI